LKNKEFSYDKFPKTTIKNYDNHSYRGYHNIIKKLQERIEKNTVIVVDCYPGVDTEEVLTALKTGLKPQNCINSEDFFYSGEKITTMLLPHLTDDRVRGVMYYGKLTDFVDQSILKKFQKTLSTLTGITLIYGVGASLLTKGDILIYADMARWEIQLRYRNGMPNFKQQNYDEDILKKNKRGYFIEWRIADKHKQSIYEEIDFYLDTNTKNDPKMITGEALLAGFTQITQQPFRLVPYFDPGVWGGQWMKETLDLPKDKENYAWSFDGVPEENSVYLQYGDVIVETPAMNIIKYQSIALLGRKNYARFGAEFPIRFDFLDTMEGQNLSLQVHPTTEYIKMQFGMSYTQAESYYVLDVGENSGVYLGLKDDVNIDTMIMDLKEAQKGVISFPADDYINFFPAKKYDHFLIPAGAVHCSSANCMVLEVSATPYIFTFKLWDWDRVGLDGLPRPIHIDDGEKVIDATMTTAWVEQNLVNNFNTIHQDNEFTEIQTGLHDLEFIETRVITTSNKTHHQTTTGFHMLNLVAGTGAYIESPTNEFEPYSVHYAETFIIPAAVQNYTICPMNPTETIKFIKAYVRN